MKKLIYIMLSLCCLVFYSCGMTEPWKDWEHEGDMSADRLRPSEVKELLCAADGWKMIYQGVTFYFQFDEEGNVASDSDETLLKNEVGTDYSLDFRAKALIASKSVALMLTFSPTAVVPAFPGAMYSFSTFGLWAIFHASACSRPPEPSNNIFIIVLYFFIFHF